MSEFWGSLHIDQGANYEAFTSSTPMDQNDIETLQSVFGLDFTPKPWYEKMNVPKVDSASMASLIASGFSVQQFSQTSNFLVLKGTKNVDMKHFSSDGIKEQLLQLELKNSNWENNNKQAFFGLKNLLQSNLSGANFTDEDLENLPALERLEVLNLFGTDVTDKAFTFLSKFPNLKRTFVWQTNVTEFGVNNYKSSESKVEVIFGQ